MNYNKIKYNKIKYKMKKQIYRLQYLILFKTFEEIKPILFRYNK